VATRSSNSVSRSLGCKTRRNNQRQLAADGGRGFNDAALAVPAKSGRLRTASPKLSFILIRKETGYALWRSRTRRAPLDDRVQCCFPAAPPCAIVVFLEPAHHAWLRDFVLRLTNCKSGSEGAWRARPAIVPQLTRDTNETNALRTRTVVLRNTCCADFGGRSVGRGPGGESR
jgi:hypothetical protein